MGLFTHLFAFVLGGLTLIPLIIFAIFVLTSVPVGDPHPSKLIKKEIEKQASASSTDDVVESGASSASKDVPASGTPAKPSPRLSNWLTVRRSFLPYPAGAAEKSKPAKETSSDNSYSALLLRTVRPGASHSSNTSSTAGSTSSTSPNPSSTGGSTSANASSYKPPSDFKFCCLKGTTLFLYEDQDQSECYAVLDLQYLKVTIFPEELKDSEMFAKRNCIKLSALNEKETQDRLGADEKKSGSQNPPFMSPWYIFVRENSLMEDWYLALKHASSRNPQISMSDQLSSVFSLKDMSHLIETLDTDPDPIPMRWFNGMFGRFFLGIHRTALLEDVIISKIHKKLGRLQLPSFLSPLKVSSVEINSPPPTFSKPMLRDLTKEGEASMEVAVCWMGEVRIKVGTEVSLTLVGRVLRVSVVLDLVIKEIEGNLLLMMKGPPSSRVWYGFTKEPKMVINVEPVVSSTHIKWSMILKPIEKQIREGIMDSVVLPNMDDISWFDSSGYPDNRGAVFAEAARKVADSTLTAPSSTESATGGGTLIDTKDTDAMPGGLRKRPTTMSVEEESNHGGSSPTTASDGGLYRSTSTSIKRNWFGNKSNGSGDSIKKPVPGPDEVSVKSLSTSSSSSIILDDFYQPSSETSTIPLKAGSAPTGRVSTESLPIQQSSSRAPIFNPALPQSGPGIPRAATQPAEDRMIQQSFTTASFPIPETTSPASSTTSLVSNWKARANTVDKQAISTSLNQAKDVAKRWGANWAAKRKAAAPTGPNEDRGPEGAQPASGRGHQPSLSLGQMPTDLFGRLANSLGDKLDSTNSSRTDLSRSYPPLNPVLKNSNEGAARSAPPTTTHMASPSTDDIPTDSLPVPPQPPRRDRSPSLRSKTASPYAQDPKKTNLIALPSGAQATTKLQTDFAPAGTRTTDYEEEINRRAAPVRTQMMASPMMAVPRIPLSRKGDIMAIGSTDEYPSQTKLGSNEVTGQNDSLGPADRSARVEDLSLPSSKPVDRPLIDDLSNIPMGTSTNKATDSRLPPAVFEEKPIDSVIHSNSEVPPPVANAIIPPSSRPPPRSRSHPRTISSNSITSFLPGSVKTASPSSTFPNLPTAPSAPAGQKISTSVSGVSGSTPTSPIAASGPSANSSSTATTITTDGLRTKGQSVSLSSSLESGSQLSGSLSKAEETLWGIAKRDRERGVAQSVDLTSNELAASKPIPGKGTNVLPETSDGSAPTLAHPLESPSSPVKRDRPFSLSREQSARAVVPDSSLLHESQSVVAPLVPSPSQPSTEQDVERENLNLRPGLGTRSRSVSETNSIEGVFRFDEH